MSVNVDSLNGFKETLINTRETIERETKEFLQKTSLVSDDESVGIGGLIVTAITQEAITKKQTLTSNPVENGVVVSDHVIKDPIIISLVVEAGDTEILLNQKINQVNRRILSAQSEIDALLPERTQTQLTKMSSLVLQAEDQLNEIENILDSGINVFQVFSRSINQESNQEAYYLYFDYLFNTARPVQIQTKYKIYDDMVLVSLPEQRTDEFKTIFNLTFQQVTFAKTEFVPVKNYTKNPSGQAKTQTSDKKSNGKQQGEQKSISLLSTLFGD
jgi:hypothetical protein